MSERDRVTHQPKTHRPPSSGRRPRAPRRPRRADPPPKRTIALGGDPRLERLTLIEFVWDISSGIQPVILASRRLLH